MLYPLQKIGKKNPAEVSPSPASSPPINYRSLYGKRAREIYLYNRGKGEGVVRLSSEL
jgi:hypothetical protein